jgi:hypothetical protein
MVEKFSTFSVENLNPTYTACEHASNTVYNMNTHALLDTTNIVELGSTAIFGYRVKTEVNSSQFPLLTHNSILSDQDGQSPVKFCNESIFSTLLLLSRNAFNSRKSDEIEITPSVTSFSIVGV